MNRAIWGVSRFTQDDYSKLEAILGSDSEELVDELDDLMNILNLMQINQTQTATRSSGIRELRLLNKSIKRTLSLLNKPSNTPWLRPASETSKLKLQLQTTHNRLSQSIEFLEQLSDESASPGMRRKRNDNSLIRFLAQNLARSFKQYNIAVTITVASETSTDSAFVSLIQIMCSRLNIRIPSDLRTLLRSAM